MKPNEKYKCKIGMTAGDIKARLASLQTSSPLPLQLLAYKTCDTFREMEKTLHVKYTEHHSHGEWFNLDIEQIKQIIQEHQFNLVINASGEGVIHKLSNVNINRAKTIDDEASDITPIDSIETQAFTCEKCGKEFTTHKTLQNHYKRKIPCNRELRCDKCGKTFDKLSNYKRHTTNRKTLCGSPEDTTLAMTAQSENICKFCNRNFTTSKRLDNHLQKCQLTEGKSKTPITSVVSEKDPLSDTVKEEIRKEVTKEVENQINSKLQVLRKLIDDEFVLLRQKVSGNLIDTDKPHKTEKLETEAVLTIIE
jgi:hypothetical protein